MTLLAVCGWICSLLLGLGAYVGLTGRLRRADWASAVGNAVLLGLALCGMLVGAQRTTPGNGLATAMLPWLAAALAIVAVAAGLRWRHAPAVAAGAGAARAPLPPWAWLLLAALLLRFGFLLDEAWLRPMFPWDAWVAWAPKAKTWFALGQVPYVSADAWWQAGEVPVRSSLAWHYPELVSRIELYLAAFAGSWNEAAIGIAWPVLWLALLLGCYGQWRALGIVRLHAVVAAYVLGSMPLLAAHAALAGYADLFVATTLVFALLAWLRWLEQRDRGQLLLALVLACVLPLLKFEGTVWALGLVALIVLAELPPRWRWRGVAAALLAGALAAGVSFWLDLPWARMLRMIFSGEAGGGAATSYASVVQAFVSGLVAQDNWHLLWIALPLLALWRRRQFLAVPAIGWLGLFLLAALVAVFGLFLLTPAAKWAASNTAINRLVLQLVPVAVSLAALLLRDCVLTAPRDTDPASVAPPPPA